MSNNDNPWDDENSSDAPSRPKPRAVPRPENSSHDSRQRGSGGAPDFNDVFRRGQQNFRTMFPTLPGGSSLFILGAVLLVVLWLLSGFYRVESDQIGVELTFGEWSNEAMPAEPGLHYHWPYPIGSVETPTVTRENRITVGFVATGSNFSRSRDARRDNAEESIMLTSDENIVDIDFLVFWRIKDGGKYLFNIRNPELLAKNVAESVMREIVGQNSFTMVMDSRELFQQRAMEKMQSLLDEYGAGILVQNVQLLDVLPPPPVVDAFNDVQRAKTDKQRLQNQAEAYENDIVPRARGQAERLRQEAAGYREQVVSRATGDAKRFTSVYEAYRRAPDVTARRMYLETMEDVLRGANKIVLDSEGSNKVLPYLPLPGSSAPAPASGGKKQ